MFYPSTRRWMPCVYRTGKKLSKWEFSTTSVKRNHQNHEKARSSSCIRRSDPVLYRFPKRISHSPTCPFQKKSNPSVIDMVYTGHGHLSKNPFVFHPFSILQNPMKKTQRNPMFQDTNPCGGGFQTKQKIVRTSVFTSFFVGKVSNFLMSLYRWMAMHKIAILVAVASEVLTKWIFWVILDIKEARDFAK